MCHSSTLATAPATSPAHFESDTGRVRGGGVHAFVLGTPHEGFASGDLRDDTQKLCLAMPIEVDGYC